MKLQITLDGKAYAVDVEVLEDDDGFEPASDSIERTSPAAHPQVHSGAWDAEAKVCRSPLTGLVIAVNVKPGQAVFAGELLIVLEAMKMETHVTAPRAGTVTNIHVVPGNSVRVNQILAELA